MFAGGSGSSDRESRARGRHSGGRHIIAPDTLFAEQIDLREKASVSDMRHAKTWTQRANVYDLDCVSQADEIREAMRDACKEILTSAWFVLREVASLLLVPLLAELMAILLDYIQRENGHTREVG